MFNSMKALPKIPYTILSYLATQEEDLWKLLAYNDYDALSKPNLTFKQKMDLIWRDGPQADKSVFLTNLIEDEITESKCILKIYDHYIHASNPYYGTVVYAFDFLYGGQMSMVEYQGVPVNRGDLFIHKILNALNSSSLSKASNVSISSGRSNRR